MRVRLKALFLFSAGVLLASISASSHGQISLPGFGQKNPGSNDQKANALLHQHLPLDLDANSAFPTVPNEDLLGGPFRGRVLPITLDTLTKPLPPGDYVLPMTFFCSEYSIHRPGAGTAYVLAPAKGTAAKAISTLLWRGMLTGHKPQELQSVSWAIQGSVAYDKMPANYKRLVDELIPDMKNQVNGQAFADIETGFQGKVNRATKKISDAIGKGTGGYVHADIKVDVELNQSFGRLGRLGKMALDGESINSIVTDPSLTDDQRAHALYAGQGTQAPPLPAANGPWSVMVPGVAYMRFVVHGGNLQGDNTMQIRILKQGNGTAVLNTRPHLVLAQYPQSTPITPSLVGLVNGTVNQAALSQCLATSTPQNMCVAESIDINGLAGYSVGTGSQSPLLTAANPITSSTGPKILMGNIDVTGTTQSVVVGQPIELTVSNGNSSSENQTTQWSVSGTTVGSYKVASTSGTALPADLTSSTIHFFWIDQGQNLSVSVSYTANGQSSSASANFNVGGPQGVTISSEHGSFGVFPNLSNRPNGWWAIWGQPPPPGTGKEYPPGTLLKYAASTAPSGTYQWFQFIMRDADSYTNTVHMCIADGSIPYSGLLNTGLKDSPGQPVRAFDLRQPFLQERARDFRVRTFLMWQPNIAGSIPVALGSITWGYISHAQYTGKSLVVRGGWEVAFTPNKENIEMTTDLPQWSTSVPTKRGTIKAGEQQICP